MRWMRGACPSRLFDQKQTRTRPGNRRRRRRHPWACDRNTPAIPAERSSGTTMTGRSPTVNNSRHRRSRRRSCRESRHWRRRTLRCGTSRRRGRIGCRMRTRRTSKSPRTRRRTRIDRSCRFCSPHRPCKDPRRYRWVVNRKKVAPRCTPRRARDDSVAPVAPWCFERVDAGRFRPSVAHTPSTTGVAAPVKRARPSASIAARHARRIQRSP